MDNIIQITKLTKYYDDLLAVDQASFDIHRGEIFGLLGPNGAGKTTTIKILTGLARPSSGSVRVNGIDVCQAPKKAQQYMGIVPDESSLYPELTGRQNLVFCGALYGMRKDERRDRAAALLADFSLADAADRKFSTYSKGMKRKLTLAAGLIHNPPLLFLDEPTTGIDVTSARQIRQLILDLRQSGVTILMTTHYIEEAERLCDRIAFIVRGRIIKVDSLENLLKPIQNIHFLEVSLSKNPEGSLGKINQDFVEVQVEPLPGDRLRFTSKQPLRVSEIVNRLEDTGAVVLEAVRIRPSLEEVFIRVTGLGKQEMMENANNKEGRS